MAEEWVRVCFHLFSRRPQQYYSVYRKVDDCKVVSGGSVAEQHRMAVCKVKVETKKRGVLVRD